MHWIDLGVGVLGVGCVVLAVLLPASGVYLFPAGAGFLGLAAKRVSEYLPKKEDK